MTIVEKASLMQRVFQLGTSLNDAKRDLDGIMQDVLEWKPDSDPLPGGAASGLPLVSGPPLEANRAFGDPQGEAKVAPIEQGSTWSGPEEDSGVYYETRTTADLAPPGNPLPVREPMLDSD